MSAEQCCADLKGGRSSGNLSRDSRLYFVPFIIS